MDRNWIAVAVLALAGAGQAVAQDSEEQQGMYVGGGIGDFSSELDQYNGANINFDESNTAYKLFVGYRFNQFFGAQFDFWTSAVRTLGRRAKPRYRHGRLRAAVRRNDTARVRGALRDGRPRLF